MKIGFQDQKKLENETKWSKDSFQVEETLNAWSSKQHRRKQLCYLMEKLLQKTYNISSLKNKLHNIDEDYEKRYEKAFSLHGLFIIRGEDAATRRLLIWST